MPQSSRRGMCEEGFTAPNPAPRLGSGQDLLYRCQWVINGGEETISSLVLVPGDAVELCILGFVLFGYFFLMSLGIELSFPCTTPFSSQQGTSVSPAPCWSFTGSSRLGGLKCNLKYSKNRSVNLSHLLEGLWFLFGWGFLRCQERCLKIN